MELEKMQSRALEIAAKYDRLNNKNGGGKWNDQHILMGLVGDIGDLAKLVMAKNDLRQIDRVDEKLAHELSDCLWSILVLAAKYNIDLSQEFTRTMAQLDTQLDTQLLS